MAKDGFKLGGSSFGQIVNRIGGDVPSVTDSGYFKKAFAAVQGLINDKKVLAGHDVSAGGLITSLLEMTFTDNKSGMSLNLDVLGESDIVKVLFSEKPSLALQVEDGATVVKRLNSAGVNAYVLGDVNFDRKFTLNFGGKSKELGQNKLRDLWYKTSYLLDRRQSGEQKALERYQNYKKQELAFDFPESFTGKLSQYGIDPKRKSKTGVKAAIIREKGNNSEREMAWCMHLAGMDVKDVHVTDLMSGRETLEDVNLIVFVGGFSNSDVLGSAKGWAGAMLYSPKAKAALDKFYAREDTLSLGVCNGCQAMTELGVVYPEHKEMPKMLHNDSHKFESNFVGIKIEDSNAVILKSLRGSTIGIWVSHGEGKFRLPYDKGEYVIPATYAYEAYPANPNGSDYNAAAICSKDGRHLAMMPHPERALRPWNWAYYPENRAADEVSPWIELFVNAREWIKENAKK